MTADASNPYRPPVADVELPPETGDGRPLAGKGRRFGTLLIDYVFYYLLSLATGLVLGLLFGASALALLQGAGAYVLAFVLFFGYYLFFEGLWARTPGKMILGTVVTDLKGQRPTFGTIAKRSLARCVPFEAFTFFGANGFHDKASRTRVVRTR